MTENRVHTNNFSLFNKLWNHLSARRRFQFIVSGFLMFIGGLLEVVSLSAVIPFIGILTSPETIFEIELVSYLANQYEISDPLDLIKPITTIFISIVIISGLFRVFLLYCTTRISYSSGHDLSVKSYSRSLHQPYIVHTSRNTSELISGITLKVSRVVATLTILTTLINSVLLTLMIVITLFLINPLVSSSILITISIFYYLTSLLSKRRLSINSLTIAINQDKVVKNLQEGLGGIRDVLLENSQNFFIDFFRKSDRSLKSAEASNLVISQIPRFIIEVIAICSISLLALYFSSDKTTIIELLPVLVAMAVASQRLLPAAQQAYNAWSSIIGNQSSLEDVLRILDQEKQESEQYKLIKPLKFEENIIIRDLIFNYPDSNHSVLDGINLEIRKGEVLGIIGETGSGKTTLLDLIMGLLDTNQGEILIDGIKLSGENQLSWKKNIAHVSQNVFLSDSSFTENIAFGLLDKKIDQEKVIDAAKKSEIHDFIMTHEAGYSHVVGEQGVKLSGGQRQRLGIARALFKGNNILVLDESTSSLDTNTEKKILHAIDNLRTDITIFMIAHRHSTLKSADLIIELKKGRIFRKGSYQQLIVDKLD